MYNIYTLNFLSSLEGKYNSPQTFDPKLEIIERPKYLINWAKQKNRRPK